jgi:hypothetical protein
MYRLVEDMPSETEFDIYTDNQVIKYLNKIPKYSTQGYKKFDVDLY